MNCDHKTFNSEQKKNGKTEQKANVQDSEHNYLKSKGTAHPINHSECNSNVSGGARCCHGNVYRTRNHYLQLPRNSTTVYHRATTISFSDPLRVF